MFERSALESLRQWVARADRKPLVIRGARQVGKTTLVNIFSKDFDQYIYLNLELIAEREIFEQSRTLEELVNAIFFLKNKSKAIPKTLIFIDEIQNSPKAIGWIRYFYEEANHLNVIAAGSLLESLIGTQVSFPVGRVEYLPVRPLSFDEFLKASGEHNSLEALSMLPFPDYAHEKLMDLFRIFTLIGGMPEVIRKYLEEKDFTSLTRIYDALLTSYKEDFEKYAKSNAQVHILRHTIDHAFHYAGKRIIYQGFGQSNYKSREMKEALLTLERAMLLKLVFPVISTGLPLQPDLKKSPKLQMLDTGMVNFLSGVQYNVFLSKNLTDIYEGRIAEHIVGQELTSLQQSMTSSIHFWTREKNADAEVDFVYPFRGKVIPIEVKSGAKGHLRSLHEFIDRADHSIGVRVSSNPLKIEDAQTRSGKKFKLINLPFYLVSRIEEYLEST
jgi:predicted AAA+ superfamily ATPase